jgi:hypothetical protein
MAILVVAEILSFCHVNPSGRHSSKAFGFHCLTYTGEVALAMGGFSFDDFETHDFPMRTIDEGSEAKTPLRSRGIAIL